MKNLKFSVVIPLYNKANHVVEAVQSILRQSVPVDEIIVVNDGSTDDSVKHLEAAQRANRDFNKVRIVHQDNMGVSVARNRGLWEADNDYIAFLDADDQWLPFFIEEMQLLINKFPDSQYYASRYQCIDGEQYVDAKIAIDALDPEGVLLHNYFEIAGKGDLPFMISSSVVKRSLIDIIGGFPPGEKIGEDQDFIARAVMQGPVAYSPNIHLMYRRDSDNSATSTFVPKEECPFSQRLHKQMQLSQDEAKKPQRADSRSNSTAELQPQKQPVDRYCAAHLCHLAKLNIFKGQFKTARALLKDERCNLKAKHKWGLLVLSYVKQSQKLLTNNFQISRT